MKILVLFHSRTGTTKKVAEKMIAALEAEGEEVFSTVNRAGASGYILAGRDATLKKLTPIKPLVHNLSDYDLVIVGTPVWVWTMSAPIRTLLTAQKDQIKQVAFFATQDGSGALGAFAQMAKILDKTPVATLSLLTREVASDNFATALNGFIAQIK